jgi:hypothetical protein
MASRRKRKKQRFTLKEALLFIDTLERDHAHACADRVAFADSAKQLHERCQLLERERNQLRRMQLLARLNMADFQNLTASIATIRSAMEEAQIRLTNIENLFKEPAPPAPGEKKNEQP